MDGAVTDEVVLHLADRPLLKKLSLRNEFIFRRSLIPRIEELSPFQQLIMLECKAEWQAFRELSPHLTKLEMLQLELLDPSYKILSAISRCVNLTKIEVEFASGSLCLPADLMMVVEKCKQLRHLELGGIIEPTMDVDGRSFIDEHIKTLALSLPYLQIFNFNLRSSLTMKALQYLGRHCVNLKYCLITGSIDILVLSETDSPLFPCLESLEIYSLIDSKPSPARRILTILHHHVPLLETFASGSDHRIDSTIGLLLAERRGDLAQDLDPQELLTKVIYNPVP